MAIASPVIRFTRKVFPVTVTLMAGLTMFLLFGYFVAQGDYSMVCSGPPIYPRCVYDLNAMAEIETLAVVCFVLMAFGALLNRRIKGTFHLLSFVVLLIMAAYFSYRLI